MTTIFSAALTSDARNTIGCLLVGLILIACLHYYCFELGKVEADRTAAVAEPMEAVFPSHLHEKVEDEGAATVPNGPASNTESPGFERFQEPEPLGFAYYDEGYEDNLVPEELVEITFDLGNLEGNFKRFLSRMQRVVI